MGSLAFGILGGGIVGLGLLLGMDWSMWAAAIAGIVAGCVCSLIPPFLSGFWEGATAASIGANEKSTDDSSDMNFELDLGESSVNQQGGRDKETGLDSNAASIHQALFDLQEAKIIAPITVSHGVDSLGRAEGHRTNSEIEGRLLHIGQTLERSGLPYDVPILCKIARRFLEEGVQPPRELGVLYYHLPQKCWWKQTSIENMLAGSPAFAVDTIYFVEGQRIQRGDVLLSASLTNVKKGWFKDTTTVLWVDESCMSFTEGHVFEICVARGKTIATTDTLPCALIEAEGDPFDQVNWSELKSYSIEHLLGILYGLWDQGKALKAVREWVDVEERIATNESRAEEVNAIYERRENIRSAAVDKAFEKVSDKMNARASHSGGSLSGGAAFGVGAFAGVASAALLHAEENTYYCAYCNLTVRAKSRPNRSGRCLVKGWDGHTWLEAA